MLAISLLLLSSSLQDTVRVPADAYADPRTAQLVTSARAARERNERLVTAYSAKVTQRLGVGIRAVSRDRMLFRQELAAEISWKRDAPSRIKVLGAREAIPVVKRADEVPVDLDATVRWLVVNPAEDYLRVVGMDDDDDGFVYPLRDGGERDYKFAAGDSTIISLPTGKRIRLVELKVIPRRSDWRLMSGSLWFDADTHGLVRAVFRPARPFEFQRDADEDDRKDTPGWVNPIGEVKFVTLEYGLYENRWWMLRYAAIEAKGSMGSWFGMPILMERVYSDYEVEGGTPPDPTSTFRPAGTTRRHDRAEDGTPLDSVRRKAVADSIRKAIDECIEQATSDDSMRTRESRRTVRVRIGRCTRRQSDDSVLAVDVPDDTLSLLSSPELGEPILKMGDMITEAELKGMADFIGRLPGRPWATRVELPRGVGSVLERARYNRVEALSLGARGKADFGKLSLVGDARIGVADGWLNLEGGVHTTWGAGPLRLNGYRRLAAANPDTRPFGVVNSFFGLMAHRDDGQYFRATGAELVRSSESGRFTIRAYGERQSVARVETDFSIPHLLGSSAEFRPNIVANRADQFGLAVDWRGEAPLSRSFSLGLETAVEAAVGDFEFQRGAVTLRGLVTPTGPLAAGITVSAGTSAGTVPVQSRFFLGGPATLRGYDGGAISGDAFWSGRLEVANSFPAARISVFSDVGWAGPRDAFASGKPLIGGGVGGSFLDGLVRLDLSRRFRGDKGWRFDLYFDGVL